MTSMTLFGNAQQSSLLAGIEDNLTSKISGGSSGSTNRRISIKGNAFREYINGKEVRINEDRSMNIVLVDASPLTRMYYAGSYVEGESVKPACWSSDTQAPDKSVPAETRQAARCMDCKQNIKGSSAGEGKACRFQQRIAIMLEGNLEKREIYQVAIPATSIFGDGVKGKLPLQAYGRMLKAHNTNAIGIVTEMRFDIDSPVPKLVFKAVRALDDAEIGIALEMRKHPDTVNAVTLTVAQMDGVTATPVKAEDIFEKPAPALAAPKPKAVEVAEPTEEAEEPKKMSKKTATVVEEKADLASVVADWDDE